MSLSPEQLELRKRGIGASESAAILGLPSFLTPTEVLRSKLEPDFKREETEWMELGSLLEPVVLELGRRRFGYDYHQPGTLKLPKHPILATPDAIAGDKLIEVKTSGSWRPEMYGEQDSDQVPPAVLTQVQHTMFVALASGHVVQEARVLLLVCGRELRTYTVPFNPQLASLIVDKCCAWWARHVTRREPLPIDDTESMAAYFRTLWPVAEPKAAPADTEADDCAREYLEASAAVKRAESAMQRAKNALMAKMQDAERIEGPGYRVVWRGDKKRVFRVYSNQEEAA